MKRGRVIQIPGYGNVRYYGHVTKYAKLESMQLTPQNLSMTEGAPVSCLRLFWLSIWG